MNWKSGLLCVFYLFSLFNWLVNGASTKPQQIALALTGKSSSMSVTWVTVDSTSTSTVLYGLSPTALSSSATGSSHNYYLPFYVSPYIHDVIMTDLKSGTRYYYKCGDAQGGWSDIYSFVTEASSPPTSSSPLTIAIVADQGATENSQMVLNAMLKADQLYNFKFSMLSGDLSYANGVQSVWDDYGNMIQPFASHVPFMVAPGNHEAIELFISYEGRYNMPSNGYGDLYYSFNYQNVHMLVLNSESLNEFHWSAMYQFAANDLAQVNRSITPWILASWHHPWYCSNDNHNDSAWFMKEEYEDLFHQYKVDVVLQGHVHAYERTHPTYNWNVDSTGPVFMTDGHGGNKEGLYDHWQTPQPAWSAYREAVYGFSTIEIFNSTHLHWQMIRANDSVVRDDFWFIRDH